MELLRLILLLWLVAVYGARGASSTRHGEAIQEDGETSHGNTSQAEHHGIHLYSWRWNETYYGIKFYRPIIMSSLIIFAVAFKIIFHHLSFLEQMLPESCVLILVGMVFGILNTQFIGTNSPFPVFSANLFFNILLPPIILDSSISLYNKQFFATFYSVIIFAVFGTLFNVLTIGFSLYGLSQSGVLGGFIDDHHLTLFPCLTFASLIAAVDPVAVLAIFEQIEVNAGLYFLVFGESLFNDGACVVLYNSMNTLAGLAEVGPREILMSVLSFFTVAFGGALIGFIHGMFVSAISRFTKHVRIVEPLTVLSCAYSSFLWAEVFHWSGIISIIAYGVTAKHYAFQNISQKSFTTVKYSVKTLACISDCIIFLFLGMSIFTEQHYYHPGFITATILLCLIFRLLSTLLFSALVNLKRVDKISLKEQLIMTWGGLRGAVGFSLAHVLQGGLWYRELFLTTALVMVLATVFLQGGTIKLMVKLLNIKLEGEKGSLIGVEVQDKVMEDITRGLLAVCGNEGKRGRLAKRLRVVDGRLRRALIHDQSKDQLQRRFEAISVKEHFTNLYAPRLLVERSISEHEADSDRLSESQAKKLLREGMASSGWAKLRSVSVEETGCRSRAVLREVQRRDRAATQMGLQAMEGVRVEGETLLTAEDPNDPQTRLLKAQYESVQQATKAGRRV